MAFLGRDKCQRIRKLWIRRDSWESSRFLEILVIPGNPEALGKLPYDANNCWCSPMMAVAVLFFAGSSSYPFGTLPSSRGPAGEIQFFWKHLTQRFPGSVEKIKFLQDGYTPRNVWQLTPENIAIPRHGPMGYADQLLGAESPGPMVHAGGFMWLPIRLFILFNAFYNTNSFFQVFAGGFR